MATVMNRSRGTRFFNNVVGKNKETGDPIIEQVALSPGQSRTDLNPLKERVFNAMVAAGELAETDEQPSEEERVALQARRHLDDPKFREDRFLAEQAGQREGYVDQLTLNQEGREPTSSTPPTIANVAPADGEAAKEGDDGDEAGKKKRGR